MFNAGGNAIRISRLAVAELISAFAIQVRTAAIGREDADVFLRQFRDDIGRGSFEVFPLPRATLTWLKSCWSAMRSPSGCGLSTRSSFLWLSDYAVAASSTISWHPIEHSVRWRREKIFT